MKEREHEPALPSIERVPGELKAYPQWVNWRLEGGRKVPVNPATLGNAGVGWANTWSSFEHVYAVYMSHRDAGICGLGFVLTRDDPFVGFDLDGCIEVGEIQPRALEIVAYLDSYTEVSPSGKGLRILVSCGEFQTNRRTPALEVYAHSRFLTLTGHHVAGTPATISTVSGEQIAAFAPPPERSPSLAWLPERGTPGVDDIQLWERIFEHDRFGADHLRRFQGDTSLDRDDHSLTVLRLLNCLARWTQGDAARMRALMLMSPLANEKWFSKRGNGDWLDYQIADAIDYIRGQG